MSLQNFTYLIIVNPVQVETYSYGLKITLTLMNKNYGFHLRRGLYNNLRCNGLPT